MNGPDYWQNIQKRGRELDAYPHDRIDSILIDPDTGNPMTEEQAAAYNAAIKKAWGN